MRFASHVEREAVMSGPPAGSEKYSNGDKSTNFSWYEGIRASRNFMQDDSRKAVAQLTPSRAAKNS